jgi:hypothetical protein
MAKMSLTPTKQTVEEFIHAAGQAKGDLPWHDPKVRDDIMKPVALRLSKIYSLKLQWISEKTGIPQQRLLRDWLLPLIDAKVVEISSQIRLGKACSSLQRY